jgi:hypothetical protein
MTLEVRVCVQNTVCRRVVSRRIHRIGTRLVEGSLQSRISIIPINFPIMISPYREPYIPRLSTCDCDHGVCIGGRVYECVVAFREFRTRCPAV